MPTATLTGDRLAPGCAVASVAQVTCWPAASHSQPEPVAEVTFWPAGTSRTSVVVPVVGPALAASVTFAW